MIVMGLVTHGWIRASCLGAIYLGNRVNLVVNGHSSCSKQVAQLIEEWNQKLSAGIVELRLAAKIGFESGRDPL